MQVKLNDLDARVARIERIVSEPEPAEPVAERIDVVQAQLRELRGRSRGAAAQQRGAAASSSATCTRTSTGA